MGAVKSTLCRWLRREPLGQPQLTGRVLELDGLWTRTAAGRVEMKVIRDEKGVALATFAGWEATIDQAWRNGVTAPVHVVSDGDRAIAAGLQMVYGPEVPHQLCHFHLLREYRRNLGWDGWAEARGLLASASVAERQRWARRGGGLDRRAGGILVPESPARGPASFADGARAVQDHLAAGTAEPGVPATGKDGNGMVAAQLIDTAPKARPDQPNHLICNATDFDCSDCQVAFRFRWFDCRIGARGRFGGCPPWGFCIN